MRKNRKLIVTCLAIIVIALAGSALPGKIMVTTTPSLAHRVFYISHVPYGKPPSITTGDYVMVKASSPFIHNGEPFEMTKRVACVAVDKLRVIGRMFFCGYLFLGRAKERSLKGEPLPQFKFNGTIPDGKLFLMGDHKDSFDSRYLGFIKVKDVDAIAYPIF